MDKKLHIEGQLLIIFLFILCASCHLTNSKEKKGPNPSQLGAFKFDDDEYNFGKIKDGDSVAHTFKFTNIGEAPLIIHDISTGCGCTVVQWSNKPVNPGRHGEVRVQFSKHHDYGTHTKLVIIKANTKEVYDVLKIMAVIQK